ncbi:hypothetical protein LSCM1_04408 [Leishmania martiniquensis]|uniref:Thioredoxin-like fold domain-containing protein n=1 Tax=Leishmania martiniquensis TaxID=1580590 RepID=A0A836H220_9TRYP|nr:hypothetical protein LSCM1_04408 [Leishmania martiniquensis]
MNYFGQWPNLELLRQDGSKSLASDVLRDVAYIVLFFGASWCPECEVFMDVIGDFYEAHHEMKGFEVVYISRDYSRDEMMNSFLLSKRAAAAAQRRERQLRRQASKQQRLSTGADQGGNSERTVSEDDQEGAIRQHRNGQDGNSESEHRKVSSRASTSSSSTPPPLKRVVELRVSSITRSGLVSASANPISCGRRGFWAVPYDHVGCVGVPILYHLRVVTYPGVVVCRNRPFTANMSPSLLPPLPAAHSLTLSLETSPPEELETELTQSLPSSVIDHANAPQRRQKTPKVARPECYPDVITVAGCFMMDQDPLGEDFPWERMSPKTRRAALLFFVMVTVLAVALLSWTLPILLVARPKASLRAQAKM